MRKNFNIASNLGIAEAPDGLFIQPKEIEDFPDEKVVVISTGSQGEPLSALRRMAHNDHRDVELHSGDTVIFSATPIPGNERSVNETIDRIFEIGATVVTAADAPIHASGHGWQEELKLMLNLTKPRYVMPFHGDHKRLRLHAELAESVGIDPERHLPGPQRRWRSRSTRRGARFGEDVHAGMIFVDGVDIGDPDDVALRDRRDALGRRRLHRRRHDLLRRRRARSPTPEVIFRGVPFLEEADGLVEELRDVVEDSLADAAARRGRASRRCSRRTSTTTSPRSSTSACGAGRWSCRSSSRSERRTVRPLLGSRAGTSGCAGRFRCTAGVAVAIAAVLASARSAPPPPARQRRRAGRRAARRARAPDGRSRCPAAGSSSAIDQRVGGLPVLDAEAVVADPSGGAADLVADSTAAGHRRRRDADAAISRARAIDAAERGDRVERLRGPAAAKLGIDPATGTLAWQVSLPSARPLADFVVLIDAAPARSCARATCSGDATGTATLYNPNPVVEQGGYSGLRDRKDKDSPLLTSLRLPVTLPRITSGKGCLLGHLRRRPARQARRKKVCDRGARLHRRDALERPLRGADGLLPHRPHPRLRRQPRALASRCARSRRRCSPTRSPTTTRSTRPTTHELVLGTGGVDDGEDADVIVHEYGHSLQDQASPGSLQTARGRRRWARASATTGRRRCRR